jgi:hypothetical protein
MADGCSIVGCHRTGSGVGARSPRLSDLGTTSRIVGAQRVWTAIDERGRHWHWYWQIFPGFKLNLAIDSDVNKPNHHVIIVFVITIIDLMDKEHHREPEWHRGASEISLRTFGCDGKSHFPGAHISFFDSPPSHIRETATDVLGDQSLCEWRKRNHLAETEYLAMVGWHHERQFMRRLRS